VEGDESGRESEEGLDTVTEIFHRCLRAWFFVAVLLWTGMVFILAWSFYVYFYHHNDDCDQPLSLFLKVTYCVVVIHGLRDFIMSALCCYDRHNNSTTTTPRRIRAFLICYASFSFCWPFVGAWWLLHTYDCSPVLWSTVSALVCYIFFFASVVVLLPVLFCISITIAIRRGWVVADGIPLPAAPDGFVDSLPKRIFNNLTFDDRTFPRTCPICLESFASDSAITATTCSHTFHTECLRGWLGLRRTCPLCRVDLVVAQSTSWTENQGEETV